MRIYISLMGGASWGGSEDCWLENLNRHSSQEQPSDLMVICTAFNRVIHDCLTRRGIRYETAPWSQRESNGLLSRIYRRIFPPGAANPVIKKKIDQLLGEQNAVLINQGGSYCISDHPYLIDALLDGNHRFEIICHSPIVHIPSDEQIFRMNLALKYCARVHVLSKAAASDLNAFFTVDSEKIAFFKNPIKLESVKPLPTIQRKIRLGFVGRLSGPKGIDYVLRLILEKDVSSYVSSIHFFGEGSIPKNIEEKVAGNGIELVKHGVIRDKNEIYSKFDMLLLPSRVEALPNVLIEAGLYGKFPLVPRVGSVSTVMPKKWDHYVNPLEFEAFKEQAMNVFSLPANEMYEAALSFQENVLRYQQEQHLLSF